MTILDFISHESRNKRVGILLMATLSGVTSAGALAFINQLAQTPAKAGLLSFFLFTVAAVVHLITARRTLHQTNAVIESALHRYKAQLVDELAHAEFVHLERIGAAEIFDRLTQSMSTISNRASAVGTILQSICVQVFAVLYLIWLSPVAFLVLFPIAALVLYTYRARGVRATPMIEEYLGARISYLDMLLALLKGAKEVKLNRARRREVGDDFNRSAATLRDVSVSFSQLFEDSFVLFNSSLYALVAVLIFLLPGWSSISGSKIAQLVVVLLFIWSSLQEAVTNYPGYVQATRALANIGKLQEKLRSAARPIRSGAGPVEGAPGTSHPGRIELVDIEYEYPAQNGEQPFRIGPLSLTVEPGQILFLVGGNGSGKSTLSKLLTGLYTPTCGVMRVGGTKISLANVANYREKISAIFTDFHLFARLYGLADVSPEQVWTLLTKLQIAHKTSFVDGRFTRRELSTGQRKRLAMVVALLEDRPIVVLDEWPADQDPEFRKYFYEELLPSLKQRGKTVIAVSHDDRYFRCADQIVILEYGQIRTVLSSPTA